MTSKAAILAILLIVVFPSRVPASEMTATLASKVEASDIVAVIKITAVERGRIHVPDGRHSAAQDFKMTASVVDRIKGIAPHTIAIHDYSTSYTTESEDGQGFGSHFSTAGFSAYGIEPGRSYIAYLRETGEATYRLAWNSNQLLEGISDDGRTVNDIGQTLDQVPFGPKLWKLRALARGGRPLALITDPVSLITLSLVLLIGFIVIRRKQSQSRKQACPCARKTEPGLAGAGQPATKPEGEVPTEVQPSTPTSKDALRATAAGSTRLAFILKLIGKSLVVIAFLALLIIAFSALRGRHAPAEILSGHVAYHTPTNQFTLAAFNWGKLYYDSSKERKVPIKLTEHQIDEIIRLGSAFKKEFRFRLPSKIPNNYDKGVMTFSFTPTGATKDFTARVVEDEKAAWDSLNKLRKYLDDVAAPAKSLWAEQPGAGQPATKPADKVSAEVQPPPPTSKDHPR